MKVSAWNVSSSVASFYSSQSSSLILLFLFYLSPSFPRLNDVITLPSFRARPGKRGKPVKSFSQANASQAKKYPAMCISWLKCQLRYPALGFQVWLGSFVSKQHLFMTSWTLNFRFLAGAAADASWLQNKFRFPCCALAIMTRIIFPKKCFTPSFLLEAYLLLRSGQVRPRKADAERNYL